MPAKLYVRGMNFGVFPTMAKHRAIKLDIDFEGKHYTGKANPVRTSFVEGIPHVLVVTLQNRHLGFIHCEPEGWMMNEKINPALVNAIGTSIDAWYKRVVGRRMMRELAKNY